MRIFFTMDPHQVVEDAIVEDVVVEAAAEAVAVDPNAPPKWLIDFIKYVGENPNEFVLSFMMILLPFLLICAFLSYKLSKMIEKKEKAEKKQVKKLKNIKKIRRQKAD